MRTLLACLSALPLAGVEVAEGLSIGGWGEATMSAEHRGANHVRKSAVDPGESENAIDTSADADIRVIGRADEFVLRLDLIASDTPRFAGVGNAYLEQAFIDWTFAPGTVLRAGRFQNTWLGWEGFHTPEMWRVQHSAAWDWNVQNHALLPNKPFVSDGVGIRVGTDSRCTAEVYVVDDVLGDTTRTRPADKAVGGCVAVKPEGVGRFELGLAWDPRSVAAAGGDGTSAVAIDLNADITSFTDDGWFLAAEIQFHRHPDLEVAGVRYGNDLVALAMANYRINPTVSLTWMIDYVERGYAASDNEMWEYAMAVLTRPHARVRANVEAFYWDEAADRADAVGAAAVLLVALP